MREWKCPDLQFDVNENGFVEHFDVLAINNYLNAYGPHELLNPAPPGQGPETFRYLDANADGYVTSYLNNIPPAPQG
jgi:hypothetical protein